MRKILIGFVSILWALMQVVTIYFVNLEALQVVTFHLGFALALSVLAFPLKSPKLNENVKLGFDLILTVIIFAATIFFIADYDRIRNHMMFISDFTMLDVLAGGFTILVTIEATRRVLGLPLSILTVVSLIYMLVGPYIPGIFNSRPISVKSIIEFNYFTTSGLFGVALQASATYVYIFVLFASLLEISGLGPKFMDIILSFAGKSRGGPAKVAVLSSGLFGMITGSPSSNVAFTGTFTIPMMKKIGFKPAFAGAVESVASSGGMIVPPLMGTAIFLMAQFTQADIGVIIIAGILPAILYYLMLYIQVDVESKKNNIQPIEDEKIPRFITALINGWHLLIPIAFIIVMLTSGFSPQLSAIIATAISIPLSYMKKESRLTFQRLAQACINTGKTMTIIAAATASAGIIISAISFTGLEFKISSFLIAAAGGSMILLVIFTGLLSYFLGMGLPVLPAYIIVSLMTAPLLVAQGIDVVSAHLFVFYFAMMSLYTPPVAPASFVAAGIAEAGPFRVGWESMKLGVGAVIVPFLFIFHPSMLTWTPFSELILMIVPVLLGIYGVSCVVAGFMHTKLAWIERLILLGICFAALFAGLILQWVFAVLFVLFYLYNKRKSQALRVNAEGTTA